MKKPVIILVLAAMLVMVMAGCSTGTNAEPAASTEAKAPADTAEATEIPETTTEATEVPDDTAESAETTSAEMTLSDTIVLPAGFTIQQAMSLEEMGIITGKEMKFYYYGLDKPEEGKPGGGYYIVDDPESASNQISIRVEVEGGQARYDAVKGFATDKKTEDIAGIGDKAYLGQFGDAGVVFTTLAVLKGNLFLRVMVPTEVWKGLSFEPEQLASDIAFQLLENLYNPAREIPAVE